MTQKNIEIVQELLAGAQDPEVVNRLMSDDAEYVSLTFENPHLTSVMLGPAGTRTGRRASSPPSSRSTATGR